MGHAAFAGSVRREAPLPDRSGEGPFRVSRGRGEGASVRAAPAVSPAQLAKPHTRRRVNFSLFSAGSLVAFGPQSATGRLLNSFSPKSPHRLLLDAGLFALCLIVLVVVTVVGAGEGVENSPSLSRHADFLGSLFWGWRCGRVVERGCVRFFSTRHVQNRS